MDALYRYLFRRARSEGTASTPQRFVQGGVGDLVISRNPFAGSSQINPGVTAALMAEEFRMRLGAVAELTLTIDEGQAPAARAARQLLQSHLQRERDYQVRAAIAKALGGQPGKPSEAGLFSEAARQAKEEQRRAEAARQAEEEKQRAEAARLAEEAKQRAEAAGLATEQTQPAKTARLAAKEKRRAEAARQAEEDKQAVAAIESSAKKAEELWQKFLDRQQASKALQVEMERRRAEEMAEMIKKMEEKWRR
jgi:hypothetical protein